MLPTLTELFEMFETMCCRPSTGFDEGNDYYVSIKWKDHPTVMDESEKFGIFKEYIRLTQSTLSGTIQEDNTHTIEWTSKGIPADGTVSIELYNDRFWFFDASEKYIAKGVKASDGKYDWAVPNDLKGGSDYYVRITWDKNTDVFDQSKTFTLKGHDGSITIKEPSSASTGSFLWTTTSKPKTFVLGKTMDITWDSKAVPADAKVRPATSP